MDSVSLVIFGSAILAIVYAIFASSRVFASPTGTPQMQAIAQAIQEGAKAYLNRQYTTIGMVGVVIAAL